MHLEARKAKTKEVSRLELWSALSLFAIDLYPQLNSLRASTSPDLPVRPLQRASLDQTITRSYGTGGILSQSMGAFEKIILWKVGFPLMAFDLTRLISTHDWFFVQFLQGSPFFDFAGYIRVLGYA